MEIIDKAFDAIYKHDYVYALKLFTKAKNECLLKQKKAENITEELVQIYLGLCLLGLNDKNNYQLIRLSLNNIKKLVDITKDFFTGIRWHYLNIKAVKILHDCSLINVVKEFAVFLKKLNFDDSSFPFITELFELFLLNNDSECLQILNNTFKTVIHKPNILLKENVFWPHWILLGSVLWRSGNYEYSDFVFNHVLQHSDNIEYKARSLLGKGIISAKKRSFKSSQAFFKEALGILHQQELPELIEIVRLNLFFTIADQGKTNELEKYALDWIKNKDNIKLETLIKIAQGLVEFGKHLTALDILSTFKEESYFKIPLSDRIKWLKVLVSIFKEIGDDFTAINFCNKAIMLDDRLLQVHSPTLEIDDYNNISEMYELLVSFYSQLDSFDESMQFTTLIFLEAAKEAKYCQPIPILFNPNISKKILEEERELIKELAIAEAEEEQSFREEFQVNFDEFRGIANNKFIFRNGDLYEKEDKSNSKKSLKIKGLKDKLAKLRSRLTKDLSIIPSFINLDVKNLKESILSLEWNTDTLCLSYRIDEEEMQLIAYLINSKGKIRKFANDINIPLIHSLIGICGQTPSDELDFIIDEFSSFLLPYELKTALKESKEKTLILSSDPFLIGVPWEGLGEEDFRIGCHFNLVHTPSLLRTIQQIKDKATIEIRLDQLIIISNPTGDLDGAAKEGELLYKLLKKNNINSDLKTNCSAENFIQSIKDYSWIHYAGHANYITSDPSSSYIELSDRLITIMELASLNINPNSLIILNACETAKAIITEESKNSFSLARLLQLKGAISVIATNWLADDKASVEIMLLFYSFLIDGGKTIAECMKLVRQHLVKEGKSMNELALHSVFGHPFINIKFIPSTLLYDRTGE